MLLERLHILNLKLILIIRELLNINGKLIMRFYTNIFLRQYRIFNHINTNVYKYLFFKNT